jgi:hypothetical protein
MFVEEPVGLGGHETAVVRHRQDAAYREIT